MWQKIKPYIDSGKKLKIKGDKLLFLLKKSGFKGALNFHSGGTVFAIYVNGEALYSEFPPEKIANVIFSSLFTLTSEFLSSQKEYQTVEFLFAAIKSVPSNVIVKMLESYKNDAVTIKGDADELTFMKDELDRYRGKQKFSVFSLIRDNPGFLYFLLLTEYAAIIKSKHRRPEKKEGVTASKDDVSSAISFENYVSGKEKFGSFFDLLEVSVPFTEKELRKNYLKVAQKLHPDILQKEPPEWQDRARELMIIVNKAYDFLKVSENVDTFVMLEKKYGKIKSGKRLDFLQELDKVARKADIAFNFGEYEIACTLYKTLYNESAIPLFLEKKIKAFHNTSIPKEIKNPEILDDLNTLLKQRGGRLPLTHLYIMAEVFEADGRVAELKSLLNQIIKNFPKEDRAESWLHRVEFYEKL